MKNRLHAQLLLLAGFTFACHHSDNNRLSESQINKVRNVHEAYVQAWLENDTLAVLNTLTEDAVLMPAGLAPISGLAAIREFWFPNDGSRSQVTVFDSKIDEIRGSGSMAYLRARSTLAFTYEKDGQRSEHTNQIMSLTVFKKQRDGNWCIARRMWGARTAEN